MKVLTIIYRENILNSDMSVKRKGCTQVLHIEDAFKKNINELVGQISKDTHIRYTIL